MNALTAAERRFQALYELDARGRLLRLANRDASELDSAPRFHLVRTPLGSVWRFRSDLPVSLVKRLATLAGKEAALSASTATEEAAPPEREVFMRRALEEMAPVEARWAGPVYAFPEALARSDPQRGLRELSEADREALHPELADTLLGDATIGVAVASQIVSLCTCVRGGPDGPTEAGIRTAAAFMRQGHGAATVAGWAAAVRERGGEPFYSTAWENTASRALAQHLGLLFIGEERHWR